MNILSEDYLKRTFSSNMRHRMAQKSVSENELRKITDISQSAINRIKNGQVCPSLYQAMIIAEALECSVKDLTSDSFNDSLVKEHNYVPVIHTNSLLESDEAKVLGFVESDNDRESNIVGFKVDQTFNCKILNNDSIVMSSIDDEHINDGDTILFCLHRKYMIGTMQNRFLKPIDNLSMTVDVNKVNIIGKVVSIETKYIKDKTAIAAILSKLNINASEIIEKIKTSLSPHLA